MVFVVCTLLSRTPPTALIDPCRWKSLCIWEWVQWYLCHWTWQWSSHTLYQHSKICEKSTWICFFLPTRTNWHIDCWTWLHLKLCFNNLIIHHHPTMMLVRSWRATFLAKIWRSCLFLELAQNFPICCGMGTASAIVTTSVMPTVSSVHLAFSHSFTGSSQQASSTRWTHSYWHLFCAETNTLLMAWPKVLMVDRSGCCSVLDMKSKVTSVLTCVGLNTKSCGARCFPSSATNFDLSGLVRRGTVGSPSKRGLLSKKS